MITRRDGLRTIMGAGLAGAAALRTAPALAQQAAPAFRLPALGYAYEALEPHIDTATMRFHHMNHHNAFIGSLNALAGQWADLAKRPIEDILSNLGSVPEAQRGAVRNSLGGHWNHSFFWSLMTPGGSKAPSGDLADAINGAFGSLDAMKQRLTQAGLTRFGSGWAWLAVDKNRKLAIFNTPYQDTPHMDMAARGAVIGVDVWEHAYYLKHQYRRADYLRDWWNTVNWDKAAENFRKAAV
jgi:Fe-Mn family superoxide dismutase